MLYHRALASHPAAAMRGQLRPQLPAMPSVEQVQQELASATSLDDFFGKEGILARLLVSTIEQTLEAE